MSVENECCDRNVRRDQSSFTDQDGDRYCCPDCGRRWVHVCDEAEGCYWVPEEQVSEGVLS